MYNWRKISSEKREALLAERMAARKPWHSPPHYNSVETSYYLITAACFEHRPIVGYSPERIMSFESAMIELMSEYCREIFAWTVLPNHYHLLVDTTDVLKLLSMLGRLHGRTSFDWNGEENARGRQVWCNAAETAMKSEAHFHATTNYVLHKSVRHGYVDRWTDWPYSNATDYLQVVGRPRALELWLEYPLYDYGKDWDPPEL